MKSFIKHILKRKIISGVIAVVIFFGGYFGYAKFFNSNDVLRYATAEVKRGTVIASVSGSGQVSAVSQVDIKPKVSGDVVYTAAENGEAVEAGTLIAQIDARDAEKFARDAEVNLESAKITLEKLKKPADALSILQAENSLAESNNNLTKLKFFQKTSYQKALESKQKGEDDLKKAYEDGFNAVSNAFLDLPTVIKGVQDILFSGSFYAGQWSIDYYTDAVKIYDEKIFNYKEDTRLAYQTARVKYDKNFDDYKSVSRFSNTETIDNLIDQTYDTVKDVSNAVKIANNFIQFYQDKLTERNLKPNSVSDTHLSSLNVYTGKINGHLLSILSIKNSIKANKEAIINFERDIQEMNQNHPLELLAAEQSVKEKEYYLIKLKAGADSFDIKSSELAVTQRKNAFSDAKEKLADYYIYAPFSGVIAKINIKKTDTVSPSTVAATLTTKQKFAEISFNEIDAVKIKTGQKATLTFDAVPDLSISGEVAEIDSAGTVSQGVVTYIVKIAFDTQPVRRNLDEGGDERVKTGMSVSASIITELKQNVLFVPNAAIKSQSDLRFVEIIEGEEMKHALVANAGRIILKNTPRRQTIEFGLVNDEFTEIVSGLNEGDIVVTRTIQSNSATIQTERQSGGLRIPGLPGGGGRR